LLLDVPMSTPMTAELGMGSFLLDRRIQLGSGRGPVHSRHDRRAAAGDDRGVLPATSAPERDSEDPDPGSEPCRVRSGPEPETLGASAGALLDGSSGVCYRCA
jgi:hypothetical protein